MVSTRWKRSSTATFPGTRPARAQPPAVVALSDFRLTGRQSPSNVLTIHVGKPSTRKTAQSTKQKSGTCKEKRVLGMGKPMLPTQQRRWSTAKFRETRCARALPPADPALALTAVQHAPDGSAKDKERINHVFVGARGAAMEEFEHRK
ncbi:hypothetical protein BaRGS_00016145 [Batillaria attramentaria]|uniref:Uncharacterized protein n=1 Tax=Batillaria attramentaria TaxID=370345 RepID=A0ABD0L094_9CAEN